MGDVRGLDEDTLADEALGKRDKSNKTKTNKTIANKPKSIGAQLMNKKVTVNARITNTVHQPTSDMALQNKLIEDVRNCTKRGHQKKVVNTFIEAYPQVWERARRDIRFMDVLRMEYIREDNPNLGGTETGLATSRDGSRLAGSVSKSKPKKHKWTPDIGHSFGSGYRRVDHD